MTSSDETRNEIFSGLQGSRGTSSHDPSGQQAENKRQDEYRKEFLNQGLNHDAAERKASDQIRRERLDALKRQRQEHSKAVHDTVAENNKARLEDFRPADQAEYQRLTATERLMSQYSGYRGEPTGSRDERQARIEARRERNRQKRKHVDPERDQADSSTQRLNDWLNRGPTDDD